MSPSTCVFTISLRGKLNRSYFPLLFSAGLFLFLLSATVQAGVIEATLTMTADDEYEVWVNGTYIGGNYGLPLRDPSRSEPPLKYWQPTSYQVSLYDDRPNVIAVWAWDYYGIEDMLCGEVRFPSGLLITDREWKATGTPGTGEWWMPNYDDSSWGQAIKLAVNNDGYPWRKPGDPIPGIDPNAEYIWADDVLRGQGLDSTAYFRRTFSVGAPIPEASTVLLFGLGTVGLLFYQRKKRL